MISPFNIPGFYYEPDSSKKKQATLKVSRDGIFYCHFNNHEAVVHKIEQLKISDRIGNIPRMIYFANGSSFETDDNKAIDSILKFFDI